MKKRMAEAQRRNELRIDSIKLEQMEQQYKTMMDTLEQTSVVRHDLAHHFLVIAEYCRRGEYERIPVYLETLNFQNVTDEVKVYLVGTTRQTSFSVTMLGYQSLRISVLPVKQICQKTSFPMKWN